jgi:APAF-1 helical domain
VVHDVMRAYLQTRCSPVQHAGAHQRLVDAAGALVPAHDQPPVPWWLLPADAAYLWRYLPYHLHHGRRDEDLAELLGELRWVEAKTAQSGSVVRPLDPTDHRHRGRPAVVADPDAEIAAVVA